MEFVRNLRRKAGALGKTIVLPEAWDDRMLQAAAIIRDEGIARVILLGDPAVIRSRCGELGVDPAGLDLIDPVADSDFEAFSRRYHELREAKGMTAELARETLQNPLFFGAMMVDRGRADGMVAGAANATGDVLRAAFQIIGTAPDTSIVSSCFVMVREDWPYGENGMVVVPGDTPASTLSAIIGDLMAIGVVNGKTTAVRIIPVPGMGVGDVVDFGGLLGRGTIMPVSQVSAERLIARGGRVPAPTQALVN